MAAEALSAATLTAIAALLGGSVSGLVVWQLGRKQRQRLREDLADAQRERDNAVAGNGAIDAERQRVCESLARLQAEHQATVAKLSAEEARSDERERSLREQIKQFEGSRTQLKSEFENLSREFLNARDKELREKNQESIGAILKPLSEKIEGFQHRVNQVHGDMVKNSSALSEQIRGLERVGLAISSDATNLTKALKGDKKLVGNWGETQLERTLELAGLRPGEHYETQETFRNESGQRFLPDFVIKLPDSKNLVVDSKVSLVDYEAAVAADEDGDREAALIRHGNAVKAHIDSLATKDYSQLPGMSSPDFVLMFMPVEPAYIEVMRHHRDLFNYGYHKGVIMVSHTTLMPILRTVANLWMVERGNAEAREISERAGDIFNSVCLVADRLQSLGASLQTATKKYNDTVTAVVGRQGLHGKVDRFQQLSQRANKHFPNQLNTLPTETDSHHLSIATGEQTAEGGETGPEVGTD